MSKLALITGATSGIGEACANIFAREGYNLVLAGRRTDHLTRVKKHLIQHTRAEVIVLNMDVRVRSEVENQLNTLDDSWRNIDVLINNAGLSQGLEPIHQGDPDDWETMLDTNVKGLLYVTKIVSNWMVERNRGHIVNLGSIAGKETYANGNVYCASKHAVDSLNKAMRIDLLPYGIKVTGVNPGAVETGFSEVRFKGDSERARKVYEGFEPLVAQDVAEAIWFAVSRPAHVNINDLTIMPAAQASTTYLIKKDRDEAGNPV